MAYVAVRENETLEQALERFRRQMRKEGLMTEIREKMRFEKPSTRRRRKRAYAQRRVEKEQRKQQARSSREFTLRWRP